jgi:hypothetical protein
LWGLLADTVLGLHSDRLVNVLIKYVGIPHRGCDVGVAHRSLYQFQLAVAAQKFGGKVMPQIMVAQRIDAISQPGLGPRPSPCRVEARCRDRVAFASHPALAGLLRDVGKHPYPSWRRAKSRRALGVDYGADHLVKVSTNVTGATFGSPFMIPPNAP